MSEQNFGPGVARNMLPVSRRCGSATSDRLLPVVERPGRPPHSSGFDSDLRESRPGSTCGTLSPVGTLGTT